MTDQNPYPPQPPAYYAPVAPVYAAPIAPPTNALAVVSMIAGIVAWVFLPGIGSLVGVITGHIALGQIKRTHEGGRGMALAGVILSWIQLGLIVVGAVIAIVIALMVAGVAAGSSSLNS